MLTAKLADREFRRSSEEWALKTGDPQAWDEVKDEWNLSDATVRPWNPPPVVAFQEPRWVFRFRE